MKNITKTLNPNILLLILLVSTFGFSQSVATYTVTFTSSWNATDHGTLPGNAHWSDMVGATHNGNIVFWEEGGFATLGIEDVAERGVNTDFETEVTTAITNGDADQWLQEAFDAPNNALSGVTLMNIEVDEDFPLLTLISMIAPSPDWFIGINSFSLLDGGNNWKDNITIDLFPYDAGTEDGDMYSTDNDPTNPHVAIFDRRNMTPFTGPKIGTLSISLGTVLSTPTVSLENTISVYPNPASNVLHVSNNSSNTLNSITIYNVLGKVVRIERFLNSSGTNTIDISQLNSGLYLVKVEDNDKRTVIKKIMIN